MAIALPIHVSLAGGDPSDGKRMSRKEAQAIATEAFLAANKLTMPKYSVKAVDDPEDKKTWRFLFQGSEEYARPGNHVLVKVDKETKKVEVVPGE
jgi:hypothetical protein